MANNDNLSLTTKASNKPLEDRGACVQFVAGWRSGGHRRRARMLRGAVLLLLRAVVAIFAQSRRAGDRMLARRVESLLELVQSIEVE